MSEQTRAELKLLLYCATTERDSARAERDDAQAENASLRKRVEALTAALREIEADWQLEPWIIAANVLVARLHDLQHGGDAEHLWRDCQEKHCISIKNLATMGSIVQEIARAALAGEGPGAQRPFSPEEREQEDE